MSILQTIAARFGYLHRDTFKSHPIFRSFQAAIASRLTADWVNLTTTIDADIRAGGRALRDRARDLHKNNDYAKRAISLYRTNVVGPFGFKLQMDVREILYSGNKAKKVTDEVANIKIEEAWVDWCKPENCSVTGKHSFRSICDLIATHDPRDGEAIVYLVYNKSKYGLQLQVIEPEALDETFSCKVADNGNTVIMGVEIDKWRRPVAYWFRRIAPELQAYGVTSYLTERERVPAHLIIHGFMQEYCNQTRGYSRLAVSMLRLKMLQGYEEAALVNARTSAAKMGFLEQAEATSEGYTGTEKDEKGNIITSAEPGIIEQLPPGMKFSSWAPEYPSAQHEMFVKRILRGIAAGQNQSYNMFGNDLEGVNYSSIRAGLLDERDMWKLEQQRLIETYLNPIFTAWLESALGTNNLNLPVQKFEKFNRPVFVARRWAWVDPLKDVEAEILQVQAGFKTATQVIAERGNDIKEVYQELSEEKALATEYGLVLKLDEIKASSAKAAADAVETDPSASGRSAEDDEEHALKLLIHVRELLRQKKNGHATPHT